MYRKLTLIMLAGRLLIEAAELLVRARRAVDRGMDNNPWHRPAPWGGSPPWQNRG